MRSANAASADTQRATGVNKRGRAPLADAGSLVAPPLLGEFVTIADAMDSAREQFQDREAYVEGDRRVTFGAWLDDADRVAALLADRGVRAGDVVAILLPTSIDYAITYAAIARLGAIATGLNPRLGAARSQPSSSAPDRSWPCSTSARFRQGCRLT